MAIATKLITLEEFWQRANEFSGYELVNGIPVPKRRVEGAGQMSPTGGRHGEIEIRFGALLGDFVRRSRLGKIYGGEVGFILRRNPAVLRAPDLAFVSNQRLPQTPEGFIPLAPDLAIEIVSPSDTARDVQSKVIEYLDAGTRLVWIVDPDTRTITVYSSLSEIRVLKESDTLDGGETLPGFSVSVNSVFE